MIQGRQHISPEDLAVYAMQLMSPEEASALAQHLDSCPECRHELQLISTDLSLFAMTAEMHSPPAQARQRLMKQVGRERRTVIPMERERPRLPIQDALPVQQQLQPFAGRGQSMLSSFDVEEPPRRNLFGMIMGWTGWAVAAGVAFFAMGIYRQRDSLKLEEFGQQQLIARLNDDATKAHAISDMLTDASAMRVTLTPTKLALPATPMARVTYAAEKGMLILQASNMEPLQPYKTYELWLIPADGRDPMPAGTFHPDMQGNVSMVKPDVTKGVIAKEFGITVEDEGGSKVPSTPILMVGM